MHRRRKAEPRQGLRPRRQPPPARCAAALIGWLLLAAPLSGAAADFDIYQSGFTPIQIAWQAVAGPHGGGAASAALIDRVVRRDLTGSQSFRALEPISFLASAESAMERIDYADWRIIGADIVALCRYGQGRWRLRIHDPFRNKQLADLQLADEPARPRRLAHRIANAVYRTVIGIPGHFDSHLLYVRRHGGRADLIWMDQDGANKQTIGRNFTLLLSPDWSPDNRLVAINTYVGNRPRLEFFRLRDGKRSTFGAFKGLNSTPEFSPDGERIAATLSKGGSPDIYIYHRKRKVWRRLTRSPAIDTTPTWSPDGRWIAFASNRAGGNPQIYRMELKSGKVVRVTTVGDYNSSPAWSPRGDRIALISYKNHSFALATVKPDGNDIRYLVTGRRIESPAWSKNGQMLTYSAEDDGIRRVYRIPAWGGRSIPITPANEDASDAVWSR
ncbi:MAG: Tol-Pal system beta propeller repeat protein TolB [Zetaproteobacteria bacterium]|nr:MAG: Tol-Pal system beta propeller repeat protein TolB [Zetaproteobacteria bacterium]